MESVLPICRVCLNASTETIDFQTRFECKEYQQATENNSAAETDVINYLECLRRCTNLPILEYDDGPQCLCTTCEAELQIVYKFLQKAQASQAILEDNWQKAQQTLKNEVGDGADTQEEEIVIETFDEDDVMEEEVCKIKCLKLKVEG